MSLFLSSKYFIPLVICCWAAVFMMCVFRPQHLVNSFVALGTAFLTALAVMILVNGHDVFLGVPKYIVLIVLSAAYAVITYITFPFFSVMTERIPLWHEYEYIIVHGCSLKAGKEVSNELSLRLDKAVSVFHRAKDEAFIIVSGGKGSKDSLPEAQAMRNYLIGKGIPDDKILLEDQSRSTRENLKFSRKIINERGGSDKIALVTSSYHVLRCLWLSRKIHFDCVGIGSHTEHTKRFRREKREKKILFKNKKYRVTALIGYIVLVIIPVLIW